MQMEFANEVEESYALMELLPMIQKLIFSGIERKLFHYSKSQLTIMTILSNHTSMTMKEIAEYLSSSKEQATRAVAPLVDAGYLERFVEPTNRVHVNVRMTTTGREMIERMQQDVCAHVQSVLNGTLSAEEREALRRSASEVVHILEKVC